MLPDFLVSCGKAIDRIFEKSVVQAAGNSLKNFFFRLTIGFLRSIMLIVRTNTKYYKCASGSAVEHLLAKEGAAGSIPVSRF